MENKLLLEGGVGGHMNHPYDNDELTFGQLKDLLRSAVAGELRGTEKTDGQNLFISFDFDSQKAKAIRNKTQIKAGGLNPEQLDDFFSDHPAQALRYSFVEALQTFENFVKQLSKKNQLEIFGSDGDVYFNTEVMNPGTPGFEKGDPRGQGTQNVVPYDKKTLLIHGVGHAQLDQKTGNATGASVSSNYRALEMALKGKQTSDSALFSIETHPIRELAPRGLNKANKILPRTLDAIDNVMNDAGATEETTLVSFVVEQAKADVNSAAPGLSEERIESFALKFLNLCRSVDGQRYFRCNDKKNKSNLEPNPNIRELLAGLSGDEIEDLKSLKERMKEGQYRRPIALALAEFTNSILDGFDSAFISDNEKQTNILRGQVKKVMRQIAKSDNEAAKEGLRLELEKLKNIENVNTPTEGFVFKYNGDVYKFTGAFAPVNQILGMPKFNRYGEITPMETIAVFPGSFKPPHRGHLEVIKAISQNADKTLVIVSRPTQNQRTLPLSGKVIGSTEAINLMRAMLEGTGLEDKVEVISGVDASPMMTTIKYVTFPADPENALIAPNNAEVILGVGEKGDDAKRYAGLPEKVSQERPDIDLETTPTPAAAHSEEYIGLLQSEEYADILEKIPSQTSGAGIELFHASDMRFLMDLSAQDLRAENLLADFVGGIQKVPGVLSAIGIVPSSETTDTPEEDQVEEPELNPEELDDLAEIIFQETQKVLEGFKAQRAPKGKPDSGTFQKKQRRKLAGAHGYYLDKGRKDLTKHGGAFHKSRPKNKSNAFLAEDEIDEMSSCAGGAIEGGGNGFATNKTYKRDDNIMKKEEKRLRRKIKIGLKEFFNTKAKVHEETVASILEEHQLRMQLREIILEQSLNETEDPTADVHDNTGINTLKDLLKNTNVLATLRETYKTLTTDANQKKSFRAHIIKWVEDTLAPVKLNDGDRGSNISEEVGVDIEGVNDEMFIDASDGSEKDLPDTPQEDEGLSTISGSDTTGRNKAERIYPNIEKSIVDYYAELDNPEDQEMFYDYLIANLKLYFDKWEGEMSTSVEEPTNDEYESSKQAV
jgi:cytidyltransferase-like protein